MLEIHTTQATWKEMTHRPSEALGKDSDNRDFNMAGKRTGKNKKECLKLLQRQERFNGSEDPNLKWW